MSITIQEITADQAETVIHVGEGQFSDVKDINIAPAKLSATISAFANSDGGDLYIGIKEISTGGGAKRRSWVGFRDVEAANGHLQSFERLFPLGTDFKYGFLKTSGEPGLVLHAQISRSRSIVNADAGKPFVRRGAQNLPVIGTEALRRLEYAKGVASFEGEPVNVTKEIIVKSRITEQFLKHVVPTAEAEQWLIKQNLIREDRPTVAGILLFAEEPQAALPKRCGVKIYHYKTKQADGFRDVLAFDPKTIEGALYEQIKEAVRSTTEIAESIPRMGDDSLERIKYPQETLHEIITNALIHRDYSVADDVHIRIFENRIEIQSPGQLPAHITIKNFLRERFARNGAIVRLLNKFPDAPNKDIGEGLNTAFEKMHQLGLKEPTLAERDNDVIVTIRHESLASPEEAIMKFLETNPSIKNKQARAITHIALDYQVKNIFGQMVDRGLIEQVPGTRTAATAYRKRQVNQ